jgi:hypothetical protein
MNISDSVLDRVRRADPIDPAVASEWSTSDAAKLLRDEVTATTIATPRSTRTRRGRRVAAGAIVLSAGLATAAAAAGRLGGPAPDRIRQHLAALDRGMPADLRLDPDLEHAHAVAATASGVLYGAALAAGGYCLEVASADRPRGAVCVTAGHLGDRAVEVTAPIPLEPDGAVLVGGRINDARIERIVVTFASGQRQDAVLGLDRYWLFEVPDSERHSALDDGLEIDGLGANGTTTFTWKVPPLRDEDPDGTNLDHLQPIFVSTISTDDDLTLVLGVEGSLNAAGAATLELEYPDGTTTAISVGADRAYHFTVPISRQHDFARATGRLVARDANGTIIASAPVSSVANSQRRP